MKPLFEIGDMVRINFNGMREERHLNPNPVEEMFYLSDDEHEITDRIIAKDSFDGFYYLVQGYFFRPEWLKRKSFDTNREATILLEEEIE